MIRLGAALGAAVVTIALGSGVFAAGTEHELIGGKKVTLTGNVVDIACYVGSGAHGAKHVACAKACMLNGGAFGIETADGSIVTIMGKGPNDKPNAQIEPFLEEKVTVTGMEFTGHGITGIRIDTIAAAK